MKTLRNCFLLLSIAVLFTGCMSYEKKMEKYAKEANEYIKTLPQGTEILCENIDSIATKIIYYEKDSSNIFIYDLSTRTKSSVELDMGMMPLEHKVRQFNDRLFVIVATGACGGGLGCQEEVFYVNLRDNSTHYVVSCEEATFLDNGEIEIKRAFPVDDSGPTYEWEWKRDEYSIATTLTDEEYSSVENKQKEKEERMAREERNRQEERRREESKKMVSWLYGSWKLSTGGFRFELDITEDNLRWRARQAGAFYADELWNGSYTLYMNRIEINGTTAFYIDMDEKRIYTPKGEAFYRRPNY